MLTRHALETNRDGQRASCRADGLLLDDAGAESVDLEGRVVVVQGDADVANLLGATATHRHFDNGGSNFLEGGTAVDEAVSSALNADAAGAVGQGDARPVCQADARCIEGDEVVRRLQVLAEDVAALLHGDGTPARNATLLRGVVVGGLAVLEEEAVVGSHEDAGDIRRDELADEAGELVNRTVDGIGGITFRGRVVADRVDDVVVDVHGGGTLELRAHRLDGVARELLIGERTPVGAFEDCTTRIDPGRRSAVGLDDHLVFAAHMKGQLSMREQRSHAEGGDRRQHRVPGVHGDSTASNGAQVVGELDADLVSEGVGDDDDGSPVGAGDEEAVERVDAPAGRGHGNVPCAHAAQGVIPGAREGAQVVVAVRVFDVPIEVGEDVVDVNGSGGTHVVAVLLVNGPQTAVRVRVASEALGCVREGDARERTQVGEQTRPRARSVPQRLRVVEPEAFAAPSALFFDLSDADGSVDDSADEAGDEFSVHAGRGRVDEEGVGSCTLQGGAGTGCFVDAPGPSAGIVSRGHVAGPHAEVALGGVVPVVPAIRIHDEEPGHERVEGVFAVVPPDGAGAFPEVRVEAPLEGVERVVLRHGGELREEHGEGTLLGLEQDGTHRGEECLAVGSLVGVADSSEVLLEVGDAGGGVEEGGVFVDDCGQRGVDAEFAHEEGRRVGLECGVSASHVGEEVFFEGREFASVVENVAGLGVFGEDAEFGFEEVGADGDEGGAVEQVLNGVKVLGVFAVAVEPRDDAPVLEQGVEFLCQPRGIDSAHCVPPPSRSCRSVRRFKARLRLSLSAAARSMLQWCVMRRCRCTAYAGPKSSSRPFSSTASLSFASFIMRSKYALWWDPRMLTLAVDRLQNSATPCRSARIHDSMHWSTIRISRLGDSPGVCSTSCARRVTGHPPPSRSRSRKTT